MIRRILWSWSWEGFCVEFEDGSRESMSARQLREYVGSDAEFDWLSRIAHQFPCNCFKNV